MTTFYISNTLQKSIQHIIMLHTRVHVSQKNNKTIETKETVIHEKQQNQKNQKNKEP